LKRDAFTPTPLETNLLPLQLVMTHLKCKNSFAKATHFAKKMLSYGI